MRGQQHAWDEVDQPVQGGECGGGGVGSVEREVDPTDVVVRQCVTHHEQPLVGLPDRQVAGGVSGRAEDLPVGVAEPQDLLVVEWLVHGVGGDGLIEVLRLAAARVPPGDGRSVRGAGRDPRARRLQPSVAADVVGVPVGVHDQADVPGVRADPGGGLLRVADEPAVDQGRLPPVHQQQVRVRKRPALPGQPGRQPIGNGTQSRRCVRGVVHHGAGEPLSCCQ